MACADSIYDRPFHRSPPAEPPLHTGYRAGILLQEIPQCRPQGLAHSPRGVIRHHCRCAVWRRARHHHCRRMVRAVLREHPQLSVQHRRHNIHHSACGHCNMGHTRELHTEEQEAREHLPASVNSPPRHTFLRLRMVSSCDRHRAARRDVVRAEN